MTFRLVVVVASVVVYVPSGVRRSNEDALQENDIGLSKISLVTRYTGATSRPKGPHCLLSAQRHTQEANAKLTA